MKIRLGNNVFVMMLPFMISACASLQRMPASLEDEPNENLTRVHGIRYQGKDPLHIMREKGGIAAIFIYQGQIYEFEKLPKNRDRAFAYCEIVLKDNWRSMTVDDNIYDLVPKDIVVHPGDEIKFSTIVRRFSPHQIKAEIVSPQQLGQFECEGWPMAHSSDFHSDKNLLHEEELRDLLGKTFELIQ